MIKYAYLLDARLSILFNDQPRFLIDSRPTVLIVSSNGIQRRLLAGLLEMREYAVVSANNGEEALEQLGTHPLAAILIDLDLPLPSQQALAERVQDLRPLPRTVGLSMEECPQAGIALDDHLQIPAAADDLYRALESSEAASSAPFLDLNEASRRIPGGMDGVRDLAAVMLRETPRFLDEIEQGLAAEDHSQVERGAHSLKGAANVFGCTAVSSLAFQLEQDARKQQLHNVRPQLQQLQQISQQLMDELRKVASPE